MVDAVNDPTTKLTPEQIRAENLDGWRVVDATLRTRFHTGDFAAGLALVNRIGAAAEEMNHHPDIELTYPSVTVTLSSHDVGGVTRRDIDLARLISGLAVDAGVAADPEQISEG